MKLFVSEDLSEQAHTLFRRLVADPPSQFYVPDLFYVECASVLCRCVRRFGLEKDQARRHLADIAALNLCVAPTVELVEDALDVALAHGTSGYDACYVALSRRLGIDLITADEHLVRRLHGTGERVLWLGELPEAPGE